MCLPGGKNEKSYLLRSLTDPEKPTDPEAIDRALRQCERRLLRADDVILTSSATASPVAGRSRTSPGNAAQDTKLNPMKTGQEGAQETSEAKKECVLWPGPGGMQEGSLRAHSSILGRRLVCGGEGHMAAACPTEEASAFGNAAAKPGAKPGAKPKPKGTPNPKEEAVTARVLGVSDESSAEPSSEVNRRNDFSVVGLTAKRASTDEYRCTGLFAKAIGCAEAASNEYVYG